MPHIAAFLVVAALIVITPGPDMALVASNALNRGRNAALLTVAGVCTGLLVWTAASAAGIVAVLNASAVAFTVVKLAGAAYLVALGAAALVSAIRRRPDLAAPQARARTARARTARARAARARTVRLTGPPFRQGVLCNLLNPKIAVLFTSLIPQFVTRGPEAAWQSAALAGIFVAMGAFWLTGFALAASATSGFLRHPRVQRAQRAVTGTALVGLGLRLAAQTR